MYFAEVEFFLTLDGDVFFHALTSRAAEWGELYPTEKRNPPLSIREMDEGMIEGIVEDNERILRNPVPETRKGRPAAE